MVYIFAFIGMLCWGVSPLFAKMGLSNLNPLVGLSLRTFFTASVLFFWLIISGKGAELASIPPKAVILLVIEAMLATLIGDLAYFAALKQGSASIVMLIMACSPVVTIICSLLFLHETLTLMNLVGGCLVIIGLILVL